MVLQDSAAARCARRLVCAGIALAAVGAAPARGAAQANGSISGIVSDSAGAPLVGAELVVEGTSHRVLSDERGAFHLAVPVGSVSVRARRLGYRPLTLQAEVAAGSPAGLTFRLAPIARTLAPVIVRSERVRYTGRLAGYYERLERKTSGYFITREQIDQERPRMTSYLLQRVPGVALARGRAGITSVRMRGRNCWPLVWLDGTPMPAGEVDLDSFAPETIQGIELYLGSTTPPAKYIWADKQSNCGTILLWSRGVDTDPPAPIQSATSELERLIEAVAVYTVEQVDTRARLDSVQRLEIAYPQALFATGMRGLVVAEFVVDTLGHVETGTFGIVSTTHPLFSDAVRQAVKMASYEPAQRQGRPVRQIVQQPFEFEAPQRRGRR